jgi:thymidylate synthase (FAD)
MESKTNMSNATEPLMKTETVMNNDMSADIEHMDTYTTKRATAEALEKILYQQLPVLDKGFIRVIDYMGDDNAIVQAARVSYGKGTKHKQTDRGLIRYLMKHAHTSPFEMCELKLHIKMPIFVARQWIRHRTANVNEYSARYSILSDDFYTPDSAGAEGIAPQSASNKQCRDEQGMSGQEISDIIADIQNSNQDSYGRYHRLMNIDIDGEIIDPNKAGLARELARMVLPTNIYTEMYWKLDLHNLLHFVRLRIHPHAQYEIRAYAEIMLDILRKWVPSACEAFEDYSLNGISLSQHEQKALQEILSGKTPDLSGLSKREIREFTSKFPGLSIDV